MAIYEGVIIHQTEKVMTKSYKLKEQSGQIRQVSYPEKSVFRTGLASMEDLIINVKVFIEYLKNTVFKYLIDCQCFTSVQ